MNQTWNTFLRVSKCLKALAFFSGLMSFLFTANLVSFRPLFGKALPKKPKPVDRKWVCLANGIVCHIQQRRVIFWSCKSVSWRLKVCSSHQSQSVFFGHNQNSSIWLKKHLQHFLQCLVKMNPFRRIFFQLGWIYLTLVDVDWWWERKATTQVAYMAMTSTYVPSPAFRVSHKSFTHLRWESGQISYPAILQIEG